MQTLDNTHEDQVTVEAETVEDALSEISTQLGTDAEIMRAQKVHRGGVGGFFAKEMVQLTARRRGEPAPVRPQPKGGGIAGVLERMSQDADAADGDFRAALRRELASEPVESGPGGFFPAADWALEDEEHSTEAESQAPDQFDMEREEQVAPVLTDQARGNDDVPLPVVVGPALQLAPISPEANEVPVVVDVEPVHPVEASATHQTAPVSGPVVPADIPAESPLGEAAGLAVEELEAGEIVLDPDGWRTARPFDAPEGMGSIDWSTTALLRLGLPAPVISAVTGLDPNDDFAWIDRIAAVVAPLCGPLPGGDVIVVGPHAERLAEPLDLPLIHSGDMAPYAGSFCAQVEDSTQDRTWLEFVQGHRGIHLVIGEEPWQDLLVGEPLAVSWVGETAVSSALYLAFTLGATLGYGTVDGFVSAMVRVQPTDVALAVRRIVGRR